MSISMKNSAGATAECPKCQAQIPHGFQVCRNCGHAITASEQTELRKELGMNVLVLAAIGFAIFAVITYFTQG